MGVRYSPKLSVIFALNIYEESTYETHSYFVWFPVAYGTKLVPAPKAEDR
tara:strand:- start:10410 stop:10559 length:150 start_codon:yes stop_codon:yes gene_type:complete